MVNMVPRTLLETAPPGDAAGPGVPRLLLDEWMDRVPGLVAGVTTGGSGGDFDLGLFAGGATREVLPRWEELLAATGVPSAVHARQVHEAGVLLHRDAAPGLRIAEAADGHLTREPDLLLTVSVADCVPVFLMEERSGVLGLVHAGWRGVAAGILERAITRIRDGWGVEPSTLRLHLGPSICGTCYEVGPEVFAAVGRPAPDRPTPIDLPAVLLDRARAAGIDPGRSTRSGHCTRCGSAGLFSHRAGRPERQVAFLGLRTIA